MLVTVDDKKVELQKQWMAVYKEYTAGLQFVDQVLLAAEKNWSNVQVRTNGVLLHWSPKTTEELDPVLDLMSDRLNAAVYVLSPEDGVPSEEDEMEQFIKDCPVDSDVIFLRWRSS